MSIILQLDYEQFSIYFFSPFRLLHFFFSNHLSVFFSTESSYNKKSRDYKCFIFCRNR